MAKLGYTWYPKDWNTSEAVFELTLQQRGLYRELIDLAMLNDNKTVIKSNTWVRKWNIPHNDLWEILEILEELFLIKIGDNLLDRTLFIPSCEPRLCLARGGKKGGKSKPNPKPTLKPTLKPMAKQRKKKGKEKEKEVIYRSFDHLSISIAEVRVLAKDYTEKQINSILDSIENYAKNKSYTSLYLTANKWLQKEYPKPKDKVIIHAKDYLKR
jgi:hypothetical protein